MTGFTITALITGFMFGVSAGLFLAAIIAKAEEKT